GEGLYRVLGGVVVPGHAIVLDEGEELAPALQQPLPIALGRLRPIGRLRDALEEAVDVSLVLTEVPLPQAVEVHGGNDRPQQPAKAASYGLQFLVPGVGQDVLVEVTQQVDQAFLLRALQ